ncbi:type II toxin-antitoxin system Phd/YefM family antitoxin [Pseudomonas lopnurensis]|uniref:type II toxin-antitoxin system Phd/YefM family antitoxin n=1 Tax=Pseudomonas lopnurensis TaxID=1477517 RepID=UPI00187AC8A6|nr:type II toxin-antitoxin system prevent-host-death family antitoxin [Pseudomonas lopnurensis]MBE7374358.1 type II toxin-antitoxin system Phd/YefM family antitoxin [Pseudomonas lopnurensis]
MHTVSLADAKNQLSRLVDEACDGKEVVIAKHGRPMARLVAANKASGLRFGLMKGQIEIAEDFDDELPEEALAGFES